MRRAEASSGTSLDLHDEEVRHYEGSTDYTLKIRMAAGAVGMEAGDVFVPPEEWKDMRIWVRGTEGQFAAAEVVRSINE